MNNALTILHAEIHDCRRCERLAAYLAESRARNPEYWSRPVSGYGDPEARLFILGLAPAYNGGNQHGRVFTGDESGRWLWGALHQLGACVEPNSVNRHHPLTVRGVFVGNAVRCAPPQNRPTGTEFDACRDHLRRELELLPNVAVVLALGKLAHDTYLKLRGQKLSAFPFRHGAVHELPEAPLLVDSYHPSRQNTNTGVLTWGMWTTAIRLAMQQAGLDDAGE